VYPASLSSDDKGVEEDTDLDVDDLKKVVEKYKEVVKKKTGKMFPDEPKEQLRMAIDAVLDHGIMIGQSLQMQLPVLLPVLVCKIKSVPSWIVNSISCISL